MVRQEGARSLLKGLAPTLVGIAPYAALNFATYDLLKKWFYGGNRCGRCPPPLQPPPLQHAPTGPALEGMCTLVMHSNLVVTLAQGPCRA
jgi:hypothetical protein